MMNVELSKVLDENEVASGDVFLVVDDPLAIG